MSQLQTPLEQFNDTSGVPLNNGYVYVGSENLNPEISPIVVYWDADLTIPAAQPLRTSGGYIVRNGIAARVYTAVERYSITVRTSQGALVTHQSSITTINDALAASTGASLIGFIQSGTGAVATTVQAKLRQTVSAIDFGVVGDGATDDTVALQAAINSLGAAGGSIEITRGLRCLIDSGLTINPNVSLVGPHEFVGSPANNLSAPYGSVGGALLLNSAATITLEGGASLTGLLIHRKGMIFPAADSSAFAGTAVTGGGDDFAVSCCMILGFEDAVYSSGYQRPRCENIWGDCINGINITNSADVPFISQCHMWPFATIATIGAHATLERTGTAFAINSVGDDAKISNCFSYGYAIGFSCNDANGVTFLNCTADNSFNGVPEHIGSQGFYIGGTSSGTRIIGGQASAQDLSGITINTSAGLITKILGTDIWSTGATGAGITVVSGDVVIGSVLRNHTNGIEVNNATSIVDVLAETRFDSVTNLITSSVATNNIYIKNPSFAATVVNGTQIVTGTVSASSVASADPLPLPLNGNIFNITGVTGFGSLNGGYLGRMVTLVFTTGLTVFNGTGSISAMHLTGGGNFVAGADSALTLAHNGAQWFEIGRS